MATGSGMTVTMTMIAAQHILNRIACIRDARFTRNALVIAPDSTR